MPSARENSTTAGIWVSAKAAKGFTGMKSSVRSRGLGACSRLGLKNEASCQLGKPKGTSNTASSTTSQKPISTRAERPSKRLA